jgi:hypothetical protein
MIQKIDFSKYMILYNYGGIYVDIDVKCLQSINNTPKIKESDIILSEMVFVLSQKIVFFLSGAMSFSDKYIINNGTVMCTANNEIMYLALKEAYIKRNYSNINNCIHIFITTGPACLSNAYKKYIKMGNYKNYKIHLLDNSYFENCDIVTLKNKTCTVPKHAIGIHNFENSWTSKTEFFMLKFYHQVRNYWYIYLICIIIIVLYMKNNIKKPFKKNISKNSLSKLKK